jgi:tRNA threonylcarbamoyladenosine biosynthesis protein TsaB
MFLFVDTAAFGCNLALGDRNGVLAMHHEPINRGHAEAIIPLFQNMLGQVDHTTKDIDKVVVNIGPGSFTGLRVGITFATMTAYALKKPVHGLTGFQVFSSGVAGNKDRLVVLDTKRDDYYVQVLNKNHNPISQAQCLKANDFVNLIDKYDYIVTGDAVEKLASEIPIKHKVQQDSIDIDSVVRCVINQQFDLNEAKAFYIRDADVSKPKASTR